MEGQIYWLWLSCLKGLGVRSQLKLLNGLGSPKTIWNLAPGEVPPIEGITRKELQAIADKSMDRAEQVLADCRREGISILTMEDPRYPQRLREIDTAPPVLYYRGKMLPFDELPAVGVVGSRNASRVGLEAAERMGWELACCGGTVISGAAKGIDSSALEGALLSGRPVAAVLGNGLDIVYPAQAKALYHRIAEQGCLLSEFVPGTKPFASNFPRRNRIISGLSDALLVVEASKKSGSLITANYALEQGRDVFAMPGSVGLDSCEGSNELLQDGAGLALSGWDVLQQYQFRYPDRLTRVRKPMPERRAAEFVPETGSNGRKKAEKGTNSERKSVPAEKNLIDKSEKSNYIDLQQIKTKLSPEECLLVDAIGTETRHVDDIIAAAALPPARVLAMLTLLEVRGIVRQQPGKLFSLK